MSEKQGDLTDGKLDDEDLKKTVESKVISNHWLTADIQAEFDTFDYTESDKDTMELVTQLGFTEQKPHINPDKSIGARIFQYTPDTASEETSHEECTVVLIHNIPDQVEFKKLAGTLVDKPEKSGTLVRYEVDKAHPDNYAGLPEVKKILELFNRAYIRTSNSQMNERVGIVSNLVRGTDVRFDMKTPQEALKDLGFIE